MAGTKIGGAKVAAKIKATNPNFYREIGRIGGTKGRTGGFYGNPELARRAGAKGGLISRRGPWSEAERRSRMAAKPAKEALFVNDTAEFGEGFFAPSWKDRVLSKIRSL